LGIISTIAGTGTAIFVALKCKKMRKKKKTMENSTPKKASFDGQDLDIEMSGISGETPFRPPRSKPRASSLTSQVVTSPLAATQTTKMSSINSVVKPLEKKCSSQDSVVVKIKGEGESGVVMEEEGEVVFQKF